jgi:hypothetical protein
MGKPIFIEFDHLAEHFSPLGVNRILIGIRNLSAYGLHKFSGARIYTDNFDRFHQTAPVIVDQSTNNVISIIL